jgi:anti-anti-sigma factor
MPIHSERPVLVVEQVGAVTITRITRSDLLSEKTINAVGSQLTQLVEGPECRRLVLNLGNVKRLSSSMVGKLIGLNKNLQGLGGRLAICKIDPGVQEIFKALALERVFALYAEEQDALLSFE